MHVQAGGGGASPCPKVVDNPTPSWQDDVLQSGSNGKGSKGTPGAAPASGSSGEPAWCGQDRFPARRAGNGDITAAGLWLG